MNTDDGGPESLRAAAGAGFPHPTPRPFRIRKSPMPGRLESRIARMTTDQIREPDTHSCLAFRPSSLPRPPAPCSLLHAPFYLAPPRGPLNTASSTNTTVRAIMMKKSFCIGTARGLRANPCESTPMFRHRPGRKVERIDLNPLGTRVAINARLPPSRHSCHVVSIRASPAQPVSTDHHQPGLAGNRRRSAMDAGRDGAAGPVHGDPPKVEMAEGIGDGA